jgi:uncharacterized protein YndB with AHSA1/START domain
MTTQQAELTIAAPAAAVRQILLTPLELADWNPAFLAISGEPSAAVGQPYAIRVKPRFNGTLQYAAITDDRIDIDWKIPGLHETGTWTLTDQGTSTLVQHSFTHSGPLARVLRNAFEGVAVLRLDRLATRATTA